MHGITICADEDDLATRAADDFIALVNAALDRAPTASVALAGGSTPRAMNALLAAAPRRDAVAWDRVRFFFGDERCVPPDHDDSNYRMTRESLFGPLGIPDGHVFRMRGEDEAHAAAAAYTDVLAREFGAQPRFDVLYLGMGPDGHTASLFPGTIAAIDDTQRAVANWVDKFSTWRITLTPHVINAAAQVVITCGGAAKAAVLADVLEGPHDPDRYPVQLVAPRNGELLWLIDAAAAAHLQPATATPTSSDSSR